MSVRERALGAAPVPLRSRPLVRLTLHTRGASALDLGLTVVGEVQGWLRAALLLVFTSVLRKIKKASIIRAPGQHQSFLDWIQPTLSP